MGQQDIAHKEFYSHPENVKDLIQGFVALDCVEQFDFSTLERDNSSYTEKEKNERHDDIVWRLKYRDEWVYIYIIIEFQSDEDETMPVRIMSYLSLLYLNLLANKNLGYGKDKKLPIVLPIVLYNGKYDWKVTKNIQDMIEDTQDNSLQKFIPKLSYYFIDEIRPNANEKDSVFAGLTNSVIATMKLQRAISREDFDKLAEELKDIFKDEKQKQRFSSFVTFMLRLLSTKLDKIDYEKAKSLDEVIRMTYTFIDREIENGVKNGIKNAEKKGEKKGKISAFYDMIKNGLITLEQAADSLRISPKQLLDDFKEYNLVL
jgi:predicted transposase/invertase (TIGR01784 family)